MLLNISLSTIILISVMLLYRAGAMCHTLVFVQNAAENSRGNGGKLEIHF